LHNPETDQRADRYEDAEAGDLELADSEQYWIHLPARLLTL
jgi:hypothetical protein